MSATPVARAALWMGGALVSFMAMAVAGRELAGQLSTFQILFFRSLVGVLVIGALVLRTGGAAARLRRPGLHLLRNSAHFVGQLGWFYGIAFIPLAEVFAIEFTTPVWTAVLASLILGERLTGPRVSAIALGFLGVLVILRPGIGNVGLPALAVLVAALGYATSHTLTKRLTRDNSALTILFAMTVIQLPMALVPSLMDWAWPADGRAWFWVVVVGVTAMSAHYSITRALALADATVVVPLDFLRLPLIALLGFLLYDEPVDAWLFLGAGAILAGNLHSMRAERRAG